MRQVGHFEVLTSQLPQNRLEALMIGREAGGVCCFVAPCIRCGAYFRNGVVITVVPEDPTSVVVFCKSEKHFFFAETMRQLGRFEVFPSLLP